MIQINNKRATKRISVNKNGKSEMTPGFLYEEQAENLDMSKHPSMQELYDEEKEL